MADREPVHFRELAPTPDSLEQNRRAELRRNFLAPIYLMWSSDVPVSEAHSAVRGVMDALNASGQKREVVNLGSASWRKGDYSSADWYLDKALKMQHEIRDRGHGKQVDAFNLMSQFSEEPWQEKPHWEVFIVNKDLYLEESNFVLGVTNSDFAASVQSVKRIIDSVPEIKLKHEMIRRLLRHEVGHMLGLPGRNFNVEQKLGSHCTNVCTMRQGMSIPEWRELTKEESRQSVYFCGDCVNVLIQKRDKFKPLPQG